jgi:glucosamine--fructose-6-phosphate aminotransferase (isomerizing)
MCGIVGYLGKDNVEQILLEGLKELEYRGYDSAGVATLKENNIQSYKAVGKIKNLEEKIPLNPEPLTLNPSIGIGHTRWATHGKPTELNAHPHLGEYSYVVHNGIIENYQEIKKDLKSKGVKFLSQTDTEVIVHLFEENYKTTNDAFKAFEKTIDSLEGAYAILLFSKIDGESIFFAKNGSPLIVAQNGNESFFSSSDSPLIGKVSEVTYLEDGVFGFVNESQMKLFDKNGEISPEKKPLSSDKQQAQKGGFRYFMEKETYEQSEVVADTILGRVKDDSVYFEELDDSLFDGISELKICACGTSYHAALASSYIFERVAKFKCSIEIASEFRYKQPLLTNDTLFVVISQSGETADTLEALKMAKKSGLKTLAICNVDNSSIVREANATLLTRAGIEKGVASTKAFATQMMVLWMLGVYLAQKKQTLSKEQIKQELNAMRHIPKVLTVNSELHEKTKRLSKRYLHGHGFFFIGRDIFYPLALEGALKLKEISYLHAEGYPSGEMKHGPIALADSELFTIALMPQNILYEKTKSNVEELSARDTTIVAISPKEFYLADDFIKTSFQEHYMSEFFEMMVVLQLLSMEIAIRLENDVDMPRNLAKSVTVE